MTETEALWVKPLKRYQHNPPKATIDTFPYRYQVRCRSIKGGETFNYVAKIVILAGGTIGTAKLLLNSQKFLPQLSDQVGQNISCNPSVKLPILLPDWCPDGDMFTGRSHPGVVSYDFIESDDLLLTAGKVMPLQLFGAARLSRAAAGPDAYWGEDHLGLMKKLRTRVMLMVALGFVPPVAEIVKNKDDFELLVKDKAALTGFYQKAKHIIEKITLRTRGEVLRFDFMSREGVPYQDIHFITSHPLGSCRMADSKTHGVVNSRGEVFDYPGMYVTDGAAIPGALIVNPSLTILANAERITEGISNKYQKRVN